MSIKTLTYYGVRAGSAYDRSGRIADDEAYQELVRKVTAEAKHMAGFNPEISKQLFAGGMQFQHAAAMWIKHGRNVIQLSEDLVASMLLSDGNIKFEDFKMPFSALVMRIPIGFLKNNVDGSNFDYILVTDALPEEPVPDTDAFSIIALASSTGVFKSLYLTKKHLKSCGISCSHLGEGWDEDEVKHGESVQKLVFGVLSYISMKPQSLQKKKTLDSFKVKRKDKKPKVITWTVDRTLKIDPNLVVAAKEGSTKTGFRLKYRHVVRGHWRNQPCGKGGEDRKLIWIAPHWKGPKDGVELVHTYKVS